MIADVANNQIFKNENPSSTFSPLYTLEIGTNECDYKHSTLYESAVFKPIHQACLSWLAIPSNYKVFGQASTQSGTWVNDGNYQSGIGIVSATHNSTASFPITTGGGNIYIWYRVWDGGGGTFTYSLDGGTPVSVNAYLDTTIATNLSGTKSIALARISGVSADDHTLLITVTSPTNSSDSVGIWSIGTVPYLNYYRTPRVYSGGVLKQKSDGNEPWVSNYNADAEADVDTLSQDGLSVYFVDVQSYENYATDIPIDVHPNNLGHRHLADAFESVIQAIPGTNNMARQDTTFSNSALTLATLITTNVARDSASWNAKVNGADSNTVGNAHYATPTWIAGNYIATGYLSNLTNYLQVARKDSGVYLGGYISPTELDTKISGLSLGSMSKVDSATFKANLALTYAPIAYLNNLTNYLQFAKKDSNTTSNAVTLSYVKANYVATSVGTLASLANIGTSYAGNFYFGESGDSYLLNGVPNFWSTFAHFSLGDTCTTLYSNTALTNPQGAMLEAVNTSHTTGNFAGASYAAYNSGGTLQRAYIGVTSTASGYSPTIVIGARSASATFTEWANFSTTGALHLTTLPASGGSPLYASGGVVGLNSSDQRLKQNINPLTGNLAKVMSLSPSSFTMIADTANRVHTGFIAQAVSPIFPQAVYSYHNNGDTTTYYGIDYSAFAPILAGAIKEIDTTFQPKGNYQTANANLTSIASLSNSTGYLYNSGVGIFSYSIPAVPAYDSLKWNGTTNTVNRDSTVWNGKMDSTRVNTLRGQDTSRAIVREGLLAPLNAPALTGLASLGGNTFSATVGAGDTVQVSITGATANARYSAPADNGLSIDTVGYIFRKWTNGVTIKGKYKHVYDVGLLSK